MLGGLQWQLSIRVGAQQDGGRAIAFEPSGGSPAGGPRGEDGYSGVNEYQDGGTSPRNRRTTGVV